MDDAVIQAQALRFSRSLGASGARQFGGGIERGAAGGDLDRDPARAGGDQVACLSTPAAVRASIPAS